MALLMDSQLTWRAKRRLWLGRSIPDVGPELDICSKNSIGPNQAAPASGSRFGTSWFVGPPKDLARSGGCRYASPSVSDSVCLFVLPQVADHKPLLIVCSTLVLSLPGIEASNEKPEFIDACSWAKHWNGGSKAKVSLAEHVHLVMKRLVLDHAEEPGLVRQPKD